MAHPKHIGLYGGTFNPIHEGHLKLAETVHRALHLDSLIFIPAAHPPHKTQSTSFTHRYAMVKRALQTLDNAFEVSDIENTRPGPSYTIDTLRYFHQREPQAQLWWLLGEDALQSLHHWHEVEAFHQYIRLAVIPREGYTTTSQQHIQENLSHLNAHWERVESLPHGGSSTKIRKVLQESPRQCPAFLPLPVYRYIVEHQLYR